MKYGFLIIFAFLHVLSLQAQAPEQDDFLMLLGTGIVATEGVEGAGYNASIQGNYFFWDRSSLGLRLSLVFNTRDIDRYNEDVLRDFNSCITYDYCFASNSVLSAHLGGGIGLARVCSFSSGANTLRLKEDHEYKAMLSMYCFVSIDETNAFGIEYNYIPATSYSLSGETHHVYHSYLALTCSLALWGS